LVALHVAATAQSTCVPVSIQGSGGFYSSPLQVGMPPQQLTAVPDTGSYDLLLDSSFCTGGSCMVHRQFDTGMSLSAALNSTGITTVNTEYGQGTVSSVTWASTVRLGHPTLSAPMAEMLLMSNADGLDGYDSPATNFDGIMGLGRRNLTAGQEQLALLSSLGVRQFTMCLGSMDVEAPAGGRLELHPGPLEAQYASVFREVPLVGTNSWAAAMTGARAGTTTLDISTACGAPTYSSCPTLIDSGTTLLTFPTAVLDVLLDGLDTACPGCLEAVQQSAQCTGASYDALPDLSFTLGGMEVSLPPSVYMAPMAVTLEYIVRYGPFTFPVSKAGVRCVPLFSSTEMSTTSGPMVILGMPFLREYVTRFTREPNSSMAFAKVGSVVSGSARVCSRCPAGDAAAERASRRRDWFAMARAQTLSAEEGEAMVADVKAAAAAKRVLHMADIRLPWWAVDPRHLEIHGRSNASGVTSMSAVHSHRRGPLVV